jgi:hypothetical protein
VLCLIFLGRRLRLLGPSVNSTSDAATILKLNRSDRAIASLISFLKKHQQFSV